MTGNDVPAVAEYLRERHGKDRAVEIASERSEAAKDHSDVIALVFWRNVTEVLRDEAREEFPRRQRLRLLVSA